MSPSQPANYSKLMQICRFTTNQVSTPQCGVLEGELILPPPDDFQIGPSSDVSVKRSEAYLLAPVAPSKVVCVGRNYVEHAAELGNKMPTGPLLFLKAPSATIGTGDTLDLPPRPQQSGKEGDQGVVTGRTARSKPKIEDPLTYVL